jgi:hypothetical protein
MIVDTNVFSRYGPTLAPDTLLVVEEMPGHISAIDRTDVLVSEVRCGEAQTGVSQRWLGAFQL